MRVRGQIMMTIAVGAALAIGALAGASPAEASADVPVAGHTVAAAVATVPDDGMTVGRMAFTGVGLVGLAVLIAALRAPSSRPSHRARRRVRDAGEGPRTR